MFGLIVLDCIKLDRLASISKKLKMIREIFTQNIRIEKPLNSIFSKLVGTSKTIHLGSTIINHAIHALRK